MIYFGTFAGKLSFIILIGFSMSLFLLSLGSKRAHNSHRTLGLTFIIPLILPASAFLMTGKNETDALLSLTLPLLTLVLLLFSLTRLERTPTECLLILSAILAGAATGVFISAAYRNFITGSIFLTASAFISVLLNTSLIFKSGKRISIFHIAVYLNASVMIIIPLYKGSEQGFIISALLFCSFCLFYRYFLRCFGIEAEQKLLEAEKRLNNVDRMMEREVRKRTFEIEQVNKKLVDISRTDPLSKALTKSAITFIMDNLINKKIKEFSVLMFDVDNFKAINDSFGHITGDKCIKRLALTAKGTVRDIDHVGRYGGDEFVIILPSLNLEQSYIVAERLRKKIEETENPHFTISIGISAYPEDGSTPDELIAAADKGLYLSKELGKNTVSHNPGN